MLLKRLSELLPEHLVASLGPLDAVGVSTTEQLTLPTREQLRGLPIPGHDLDQLIAHCLQLTGAHAVSGDRLAEQQGQTTSAWEGWGADGLDALLQLEEGGLIEIAGAKRVGRSLLALHAALRMLIAHPDFTCRWIDTEASFNAARAKSILDFLGAEDIDNVMERLIVTPCFSMEPDLFDIIAQISEECADETLKQRPGVLVVDQISSLFRATLSAETPQAMVTVMENIGELTYSHDLCTIVVNSTATSVPKNDLSSFSVTASKPALGSSYTYHVDVSLLVQDTGKVFGLVDENERQRGLQAPGLRGVVEVLKSRVSPAGTWAVFETDGISLLNVVAPPEEDYRTLMLSAGRSVGEERPIHGPLRETVIP